MEFSISNGDEWRAKHTVKTTNLNMILKIVDFYHKIQYSKFISQDTIFQREKHNTEKKKYEVWFMWVSISREKV